MRWDQETDVIVVGGGGTGLAAALEAATHGVRVTLLEKCPELGGTTGIAVGSFTAACTSMQKAAGIQDDVDWHNQDMGKFAAHREPLNNAELRSLLARTASETLEWLMSIGLEFYGPSPEPPNRVPRMHNVVPNAKAYVAVMQRRALERGARLLVGHAAVRLARTGNGPVEGVEVRRDGGGSYLLRARKGVILAAGDYSNGDAVKRDYLPVEIASVEGINPNATGDGHRLARDVGAALVNMELVYGPEIRFISPPRKPFAQLLPANPLLAKFMGKATDLIPKPILRAIIKKLLVTWQHPEPALLRDGAVLINRLGERFADEAAKPELDLPRQPGRVAYIVLDETLAARYSQWPHFISTAPDVAYAYVQDYQRLRADVYAEAGTIPELARKIGVPGEPFAAAIGRYNRAVSSAAPDPFGRAVFGAAIEKPPFRALGPVRSWIVTTEGGVMINERMEALDTEGRVIPGLYAAGSTGTGGIVIWGHGLHIAWAFTSGRIAGRNAALSKSREN